MLGAPFGASTALGKSGVDSLTIRPIFPLKGASGRGNTLASWDAAVPGSTVDATADAAMTEVEPSSLRRLIPTVGDETLCFLSDLSSLIAFTPRTHAGYRRFRREQRDSVV